MECQKISLGIKNHMVYALPQAYKDKAGSQQLIDDMWRAD
jgi:hypothetical protein